MSTTGHDPRCRTLCQEPGCHSRWHTPCAFCQEPGCHSRWHTPCAFCLANQSTADGPPSTSTSGDTTMLETLPATQYCTVCGNQPITTRRHLTDAQQGMCDLCEPFLDGPLATAFEALKFVGDTWGVCCGGISSDIGFGRTLDARVRSFSSQTHLQLHPKTYGESSHTVTSSDGATSEVVMQVECGIRFDQDKARFYWIFDNDQIDTHSEPLDGEVSYAQDGERFLEQCAAILRTAAAQAYMGDFAQCDECGGHYVLGNDPCHPQHDDDEDVDIGDSE